MNVPLELLGFWVNTTKPLTNGGVAVAQEVEWLSANRKVAGSIPKLLLAKCGGVPEQDTSPYLLLTCWLLPCMVDTAMGECAATVKRFG